MKRFLIILLILIGLGAAGVYGYQNYLTPAEPGTLREDPRVEIVPVERETLVETISATGRIEPEAEVEMKFETGGKVKEVLVKEGEYITAGTVLARLYTTDLELEVRRAEIDLNLAVAQLKELYEPELPENIAAAQASVESARLRLAELQDGPDPDEVTKAEVSLKQTEIALQEAQWAYDQVSYRGNIGAMSQSNELQAATLDYESALADYNLAVKEASPAEVADARSSLASAQSNLAELLQEPGEAEVIAAQSAVEQAELALEEAETALEDTILIAPTNGVVLTVNIEPGERVLDDDSEAAMNIANTSTYLLKMEVDELDIGQVRHGQRATVTLDAFAEQTFEGRVTDVAPSPVSTEENSIVSYQVTITLDTEDQNVELLSGMTASANIETQQIPDALVAPNRAIQVEQNGRRPVTYVEKLDSQGNVMRVEIATGMRSGSVTEVLAGLEEGDQVVIGSQGAPGASGTSPGGFRFAR